MASHLATLFNSVVVRKIASTCVRSRLRPMVVMTPTFTRSRGFGLPSRKTLNRGASMKLRFCFVLEDHLAAFHVKGHDSAAQHGELDVHGNHRFRVGVGEEMDLQQRGQVLELEGRSTCLA